MSRPSNGFVGDSTKPTTVSSEHNGQQQQRQTPNRDSEATSVDEKEQIGLSDPEQPDVPQITSHDKDLEKGEVPPEKQTAADAAKERNPNLVRYPYIFVFEISISLNSSPRFSVSLCLQASYVVYKFTHSALHIFLWPNNMILLTVAPLSVDSKCYDVCPPVTRAAAEMTAHFRMLSLRSV